MKQEKNETSSSGKSRSLLKFKVDDGLQKISNLYEKLDRDPHALDACWEKPEMLLDGIVETSGRDIEFSQGYKRLADAMSSIEFEQIRETVKPEDAHKLAITEDKAVTMLRNAVCGRSVDDVMDFGAISDDFNNPSIVAVVVLMITVTVTSGSVINDRETPNPKGPSLGMIQRQQQLAQLTAHAQTVADQLGWYADA